MLEAPFGAAVIEKPVCVEFENIWPVLEGNLLVIPRLRYVAAIHQSR